MSLSHYDELKALSRLHSERNEESLKDLEAARTKQAHSSQVVAHLSEKVCYLSVLKKELAEKLEWLVTHLASQREKLNVIKMERDKARKEGHKIREGTGIMFAPTLLHDLDNKIKLRNRLILELQRINLLFTDAQSKAKQDMPVDTATYQRNMARGNIPLLPQNFDDDESMDVICAYTGSDSSHVDRQTPLEKMDTDSPLKTK